MKTFGQFVVDCLTDYGVEYVFGIPGVHTIELYRGLTGSGIRHVTPRHEQGAGFMADGYARVSGKPGVCFIITGPGLTNIATAMGQAYGDSIPMLVISTVNSAGALGSGEGHLHELPDQRQLMRQVTAFSHTIHHPQEFETVLARAFAIFESSRPRPIHIEIPVEMLGREVDFVRSSHRRVFTAPPTAHDKEINEAAQFLNNSQRPLLIAGGGATGAAREIEDLASRLRAPVLMTINGRGILAAGHPLGLSISAASPAALDLMERADAILAVGTELGPTDFDETLTTRRHLGEKLVRIDIDPEQLVRSLRPAIRLVGDSKATIEALSPAVRPREAEGWGQTAASSARHALESKLTAAQRVQITMLETLRDTLPGVVIVGDSNQPVYAGCMGFEATAPKTFFNSATGYGTLGYGLPAALGAKIAAPELPVVALMGDGGLQFTLAELGSVTEYGAPLILVLWNNNGYHEIERAMVRAGIDLLGVRIFTPDFKSIATAFDWRHETASDVTELSKIVKSAAATRSRIVVELDEAAFCIGEASE
ncbi:5-guanidino-2-oxopentanoate decarboxylase [Rhizobium sp. GN54]|uniref:5-guanidino-2-oxopentanoate decarboxylase n=1 Tax=Rhizobium sp. GN54 TaxID=2898150 RepID=UPI001E5F82DE|nr:5-guanidino-2-oxopentanoate decarboxylase [Rhizobium sp. GN54]MCD2184778.1 5-guanidino-2-oxopentanoate decarboxylase [Rhizobium sp. GN54]